MDNSPPNRERLRKSVSLLQPSMHYWDDIELPDEDALAKTENSADLRLNDVTSQSQCEDDEE